MIHIVKGFSIVNKAEVDVFLEFPCFLYDPMNAGNLVSGSSAFSKSSLYIWKFSVHVLLKSSLKDFEHHLARMWNECNCTAVWTYSGIALLWNWNKNQCFPVLWPLLKFPNLLAYWMQCFNASSFRIWNTLPGILSSPLALFVIILPEAHLTSHSRMSGSRWVTTPLWLFESLRPFLYSSSVYSCHLFLISSALVRSLLCLP